MLNEDPSSPCGLRPRYVRRAPYIVSERLGRWPVSISPTTDTSCFYRRRCRRRRRHRPEIFNRHIRCNSSIERRLRNPPPPVHNSSGLHALPRQNQTRSANCSGPTRSGNVLTSGASTPTNLPTTHYMTSSSKKQSLDTFHHRSTTRNVFLTFHFLNFKKWYFLTVTYAPWSDSTGSEHC